MLTVLGEAIVDLVAEGDRRYVAHPGGSPLNVAVGLGRLGQPVSLAARLSGDAFGAMFREHLLASHVDARHLVAAPQPSTLAVATVDEAGVAAYDFWTEGTADWQWTEDELAGVVGPDTLALHTGSLALELEPGAARVVDLLARTKAAGRTTISYDPNVRMAKRGPAEAGRAAVERVVALADLVKVSSEDLAWLYPGDEPVAAANRWLSAGPALVVVTLGPDGAVALAPGRNAVHRDAPEVTVVDTVGAGDAFSSGLLGALAERGALGRGGAGLAGIDLPGVLDRAGLVAALTCARPGADPPTLAEVAEAENPRPEGIS
ncbi:MAG TPA: carbohydrate kinase [Mycobacteriales bacterium]|jgi:fructokinase|nr:carbohydrate kinase [Mycobacteriales bacterium]